MEKILVTVENCENHAEAFGKALCEALGWEIVTENIYKPYMRFYTNKTTYAVFLDRLIENTYLNLIHEAEDAVLKRISNDRRYVSILVQLITKRDCFRVTEFRNDVREIFDYNELIRISTADAKTRLVACLLALGINEIMSEKVKNCFECKHAKITDSDAFQDGTIFCHNKEVAEISDRNTPFDEPATAVVLELAWQDCKGKYFETK